MTITRATKNGKIGVTLVTVVVSALLLFTVGLAALQHGFGDSSSKTDVGATVKNLVGGGSNSGNGNESASANVNANSNGNANANANVTGQSNAGGANANASANAGSSSNGEGDEHKYKSDYDKKTVDSDNGLVVSTNHHLYKPGEEVKIEGAVSTALITSLQLSQVNIQVTDNNDNNVTTRSMQLGTDGSYDTSFTLPSDAKQGAYTVTSTLQVKSDLLNTLSANVKTQLSESAKFVVISPNAFAVKAHINSTGEDKDYSIDIASNSTVSNVAFDVDGKKLTFTVEGQSGTHGVTQVTIPKEMLSGNLQVMIDGAAAADNDVIVTSDTSTDTTLELNYHHSTHDVTITGTSVVPEFPLSMILVMTGAIGSIVVLASRMDRITGRFGP